MDSFGKPIKTTTFAPPTSEKLGIILIKALSGELFL
jgi:hypothetical protein